MGPMVMAARPPVAQGGKVRGKELAPNPKELERASKKNAQDYPQGIPACGSDALRFGLLSHCGQARAIRELVNVRSRIVKVPKPLAPHAQGRDVNLDINRVVGYRNFCNKLWNATRFAMNYFGDAFRPAPLPVSLNLVGENSAGVGPSVQLAHLPDAWILSRLAATVRPTRPISASSSSCAFFFACPLHSSRARSILCRSTRFTRS